MEMGMAAMLRRSRTQRKSAATQPNGGPLLRGWVTGGWVAYRGLPTIGRLSHPIPPKFSTPDLTIYLSSISPTPRPFEPLYIKIGALPAFSAGARNPENPCFFAEKWPLAVMVTVKKTCFYGKQCKS